MMSFRHDTDAIKNKKLERALVRRVLGFAKPYTATLSAFLVYVVLGSVFSALPALIFKRLLDHTFPRKDTSELLLLSVLAVVLAIAGAATSLGQRYCSAKVGEGLIYDLRVSLFDHIQRLPLAFFTRTHTGSLMSRLNNDVIGAQQAVTGTLGNVVSNAISLVVTMAIMLGLEWRLTLLSLVVLPAFVIPAKRVGRRLQVVTRKGMTMNAEMNQTISERFNVAGALLVKVFGRPDEERDQFAHRARTVADVGITTALLMRVLFVALGLVAAIGTAAMYYVGGRLVISGAISYGTVAALVIYVGQIYMPLTQLTNARVDVMTAFVSFERVFEILDFPSTIEEAADPKTLVAPKGEVAFQNVWFRHPAPRDISLPSLEGGGLDDSDESDWIIRDVSFRVAPGELVAIVGPSGAGKSTIAMLADRLYDVSEGSITVDGVDVRELSFQSLRGAVGMVMQDPHLFHDSIAANLRYAMPDATNEELVSACRGARIHDLIATLPDGYDTIVGERGYRLSGGEKQRLSLARILLKDPAVVILDEATSALDAATEYALHQALAQFLSGRTTLIIAHRLSAVKQADRVLVFDGGRIAEDGGHQQLIADGGLYAKLYGHLQH